MAFLSVITRHLSSRPSFLAMNKASLRSQSDPDYEQIIEVDKTGRGWEYILEMLKKAVARAEGDYILTLDDDDLVINQDAIRYWKETTKLQPAGVIHKCDFADLGILPDEEHWGKRPEMGQIGSFSYILRRDIMLPYLERIGVGNYASDYELINAIWQDHHDQISWLDQVICKSIRRSMGRGE